MDDLAKTLHEQLTNFWKCYKNHILNDGEEFWEKWEAELTQMDEELRNDKVKHAFHLGMVKGFADATSEYMKAKK